MLSTRFTAMYGRNFKPKIFTDITMPAKLFVAQILARVPGICISLYGSRVHKRTCLPIFLGRIIIGRGGLLSVINKMIGGENEEKV